MNPLQRVVILGATSAIATAVARQLVARGATLVCVGRDGAKLDALLADLRVRAGDAARVHGIRADLDDVDGHAAVWDQCCAQLGEVDAVLLAWGVLPDQQACAASVPATLAALHSNGTSAVAMLTRVANTLQQQRRGVIAAISSVAGDRGRQSNYVYGAAKGMLTLFLQGLRNRLARDGVAVVTIKPGFVDTPMTAAFDKSGPLWASADQVGAGIVRAMARGSSEAYLPGFWRLIMLVIRHIPEAIFKRMSL